MQFVINSMPFLAVGRFFHQLLNCVFGVLRGLTNTITEGMTEVPGAAEALQQNGLVGK